MKAFVPAVAVVAFLMAVSSAPVAAQSPLPAPSPAPVGAVDDTDPDPDSADLSITGSVTYRELTFDQAGTPKVEFTGVVRAPDVAPDAKLHTVWHADRGTLPKPVQPGVTYGNNTVRLTITARFEDLARLFAADAAADAAAEAAADPGTAPTATATPPPPPERR